MITLPQGRKWTVANSGDVFGTLYSTYNVHFDEEGYAKIAPKTVAVYSKTVSANFRLLLSSFYFSASGAYFLLTGTSPYSLSGNLTFTEITGGPTINATNSDATPWQSRAYVTTTNNLAYWDSSTWTTGLKSLTSGVPHPLEVMGNFSNGHLAVGSANTVLRLDTSHATAATLTLNDSYEVTCLKYFNSNLYVGTRSKSGQEAKVFVWNGSGSSAQSEYRTGAAQVMALEEYKSSIVGITQEGQLVRFSGGGFETLANLPFYHTPYRWAGSKVHRRGLKKDGDIIYLNIDGAVSKTDDFFYLPNQPSGIWCFDPKVGLYSRHLSTIDPLNTVSVASINGNELVFSNQFNAVTGEPVYISTIGSLTGISVNTTYYIVKTGPGKMNLAYTPADAQAGNVITLGGSVGGAAVKMIGYTQYGEKFGTGNANVGAIGLINLDTGSPRMFPTIVQTGLIWGYTGSDGIDYLNCLSSGRNYGGFVTNKIWSSQVKDHFDMGFLKYAGLQLSDDRIIIKTRSSEVIGLPTTSFNPTVSATDRTILESTSNYMNQAVANYNVNFLTGNGAGQSAKLSTASSTQLTMDAAVTEQGFSDSVYINIDNFKRVKTITTDGSYAEFSINEKSSWVQAMIELRGQSVKVEEIQLDQTVYKPT